eukprot:scaffold99297_cov60-Phaeocystis_antarctica.AAC.2
MGRVVDRKRNGPRFRAALTWPPPAPRRRARLLPSRGHPPWWVTHALCFDVTTAGRVVVVLLWREVVLIPEQLRQHGCSHAHGTPQSPVLRGGHTTHTTDRADSRGLGDSRSAQRAAPPRCRAPCGRTEMRSANTSHIGAHIYIRIAQPHAPHAPPCHAPCAHEPTCFATHKQPSMGKESPDFRGRPR